MPFEAIAKYVRQNWQSIGLDGKTVWEHHAVIARAAYIEYLKPYKRPKNNTDYQAYLATFEQFERGRLVFTRKKLT
jgi:hypothetical protein